MYNVVQGKNFRLDQHSAEVIDEKQPIFRIPIFGISGQIAWKGCFIDPCTALASLKNHCDKKHLREEKQQELMNIFYNSLSRKDQEDPITKDIHLTITAAPSANLLKLFGGALSYEEYRKRYDDQGLMHKVFVQKIPDHEANSAVSKLASGGGDPNSPTTSVWNCCMIPNDGKLNNDFVAALPQMNVPVPRNMYYCLSWLQEMYKTTVGAQCLNTSSLCDSFTVTVHTDKKNVFAVGNPVNWGEGAFNNLASNMLGRQQVFGDVFFISKNGISYPKKRKGGKKKQAVQQQVPSANLPVVPVSNSATLPTSTTTPTLTPAPTTSEVKPTQQPRKRVKKGGV